MPRRLRGPPKIPAPRRGRKTRRGDGFEGGGGNIADNLVNSALRYRAQAPLVDQLLREIGIEGGDVGKLARGMLERPAGSPALTTEPAQPPAGE